MKYLFYIAKSYSIPIIKPLVNYLERSGENYSFYVSQNVKDNFPKEWDLAKIADGLKAAKSFDPDYVLCPGNFVDFRIPGIKVQLFHGLGVEKSSHYKIRHFFDIYLTSGPYVTRQFEQLQKQHSYFVVKETGWAKVDYILQYDARQVQKELRIPENKKVILYAPTFSKTMESASELLPFIPKIIREDEFWLMKFHELMDKEVIRQAGLDNIQNIRIVDTADITPLLHVSDVLVSDTSSVVYEFMVLKKPVITYKTQKRADKGINIQHPASLRNALDQAFNGSFVEKCEEHLAEINPYVDGEIADRVFTALAEVKKKNLLKGKRKPANFFRKWQVIYHSIFKKGYLR